MVDLPAEVASFLADIASLPLSRKIVPLSLADAVRMTMDAREDEIAAALGLIALVHDDNGSFFAYATLGPAAGTVVRVDHAGPPGIAFPDLSTCKGALHQGIVDGLYLMEVPIGRLAGKGDQGALKAVLPGCLRSRDEIEERLAPLFAPLIDPDDLELHAVAVEAGNFFVREAVAKTIISNPRPSLVPLAERLAADRHPQVWRCGRRAVKALGLPPPPWTAAQQKYRDDVGNDQQDDEE